MTGLYFPEEKVVKIKCPYQDCAWAMGLVGKGICVVQGLWWMSHCPAFKDEEKFEEEWRERDGFKK